MIEEIFTIEEWIKLRDQNEEKITDLKKDIQERDTAPEALLLLYESHCRIKIKIGDVLEGLLEQN